MDSPGNINVVRGYGAGAIRVGEQSYTRVCVVAAQTLLSDWPPESLDEIQEQHLPTLLALQPEIVLIGSAGAQSFAPRNLRRWFAAKNIALEPMELGAACRTYNVLAQEGRPVVAVLFPA